MKNRYLFLKRQYSDYLILFYKKGKMTSYSIDKKIFDYITKNNINIVNVNYIIIDEKNNIDKHEFKNNKYYELLKKYYVNSILNKIINSIDEKTHLIINSDDAFVNRLKYLHKGEVTTYGIGKTKYSLKEPISNNVDAAYCPICHEKLVYKFYHYGHLGSYSCPNGDFKNNIDIKAEKVDLEKQEMVINDNIIHLNKDVFFAVYYTLAAYSLCKVIGMEEVKIIHALNDEVLESKRLKSLKYHNREVDMLESKNENNLSYLQSLNYINNYKGKKTIILGFDNVSRRYKYNDISWLYDVDFEVLDLKNIDKILCIGRFRYDVYARLRLANIDEDKLVIVDNIKNISEDLDKTEGTIFTMVCFDMTAVLKKIFMEDNND